MSLNLLPSQAKFQAARIKLKEKIKMFLIIFSIAWFLLILVVIAMWIVVNAKTKNSAKKYSNATKQYASLSNNVILTERLKYQAKLVGKILNDRFEYSVPLRKINDLFSEKIIIEKFDIREKNLFVLTGKFSGNKNMDEVENKIKDINGGLVEGFSSARMASLTTISGFWKFEMEVITK